ncbi:hypothetical protein U0070_001337, partial [Myodes glareolus]
LGQQVLECWVLLLGVRNLERTQLVQEELVMLGANQLEYHYGKAMPFIFVGVCQLDEAGVTDEVLDTAMQALILEMIAKHGEPVIYAQCMEVGRVKCLPVYCEQLVLHRSPALTQVHHGLPRHRLKWHNQVIKHVNLEALSKWTCHIPGDMLGYDPFAKPPNYGNHDPIVINHTHQVLKGDYRTPANLKGYFQVNQNSTSSHLG